MYLRLSIWEEENQSEDLIKVNIHWIVYGIHKNQSAARLLYYSNKSILLTFDWDRHYDTKLAKRIIMAIRVKSE